MNMIASLSDMGNVQDLINQTAALDLMDIDVPENNSKRPHDNAQEGECVPSKQSRLTSPNKYVIYSLVYNILFNGIRSNLCFTIENCLRFLLLKFHL